MADAILNGESILSIFQGDPMPVPSRSESSSQRFSFWTASQTCNCECEEGMSQKAFDNRPIAVA